MRKESPEPNSNLHDANNIYNKNSSSSSSIGVGGSGRVKERWSSRSRQRALISPEPDFDFDKGDRGSSREGRFRARKLSLEGEQGKENVKRRKER